MSRFGNPCQPAGEGAPDVVHVWAVVDPTCGAMVLFSHLEEQIEKRADELHALVLGTPAYETFRTTDPGVPAVVLQGLPAESFDGRPLAVVHAYAFVGARNTGRTTAAAVPLNTH